MDSPEINFEIALSATVAIIKAGNSGGSQEYDIHINRIARQFLIEQGYAVDDINKRFANLCTPYFADAAWDLVRLGVLRPGEKNEFWYMHKLRNGGTDSFGFCITEFGKGWFRQHEEEDFVPVEPGAYGKVIEKYGKRFGPGFMERALEANKCYRAGAYNACTAMCGAAAESVILQLASVKAGDEERVIGLYKAASGRRSIYDLLMGDQPTSIKKQSEGLFDLLSYWRDESTHGIAQQRDTYEAQIALQHMLKFIKFADMNYEQLTKKKNG